MKTLILSAILVLTSLTGMAQTSTSTSNDDRWEFITLSSNNEPVSIDKESIKYTTRDGQATSQAAAYYVEFWWKTLDKDSKDDPISGKKKMLLSQIERTPKRQRLLSGGEALYDYLFPPKQQGTKQ